MSLLDAALQSRPDDMAVLEARADGLMLVGRPREAFTLCEAVLARSPRRQTTLAKAATLSRTLGMRDAAVDYWKRLIELNPTAISYRADLANVLGERGDWQQAVSLCEEVLRQYPPNLKARLILLNYYLARGDRDHFRAVGEQVLALHPQNEDSLRRWFEERVQRMSQAR